MVQAGKAKFFQINNNLVCKIYNKEKITDNKIEKLSLICSKSIDIDGVCWPIDLAKNRFDQVVGYIMPKAQGMPMQRCMFVKPLLEKYFPGWKREHLVSIAQNIVQKIKELHNRNILIGDINPLNIIVESYNKIHFVDTDSYQIEHFPCSVGMINYTAPEIQGKKFPEFLRTEQHELFAIATLIFMILLPGKPPYSHQGGGSPGHNIKESNFSYPLGKQSNKKTPEGPWRFIWSNLPFKIKEALYHCFKDNKRPSIHKWIDLLEAYQNNIRNGYVSNEIFPKSFKKVSTHAQEEYGAKSNTVQFICSECRDPFEVPLNYAEKMKGFHIKLCHDCAMLKKQKREQGTMISCIDCKTIFLFSISEQEFFNKKGFDSPIRCKDCRSARRDSKSYSDDSSFDILEGIKNFWNFFK